MKNVDLIMIAMINLWIDLMNFSVLVEYRYCSFSNVYFLGVLLEEKDLQVKLQEIEKWGIGRVCYMEEKLKGSCINSSKETRIHVWSIYTKTWANDIRGYGEKLT